MQRDFEGHFWGPTERPSTYTNLRKAYKNCRIKDSVGPVTLKHHTSKTTGGSHWRLKRTLQLKWHIISPYH